MITSRFPWFRRWFGGRSERAAARFLKARGHRVITRNWRCPLGELDLITRVGPTLVFVEVRSTEQRSLEKPGDSVDAQKQARLGRLALAFIQRHQLFEVPARFDVVLVSWPAGQRQPNIEHHPSAFPLPGRYNLRA